MNNKDFANVMEIKPNKDSVIIGTKMQNYHVDNYMTTSKQFNICLKKKEKIPFCVDVTLLFSKNNLFTNPDKYCHGRVV